MAARRLLLIVTCGAAGLAGCAAPRHPPVEAEQVAPDKVLEFAVLYRTNCAGCHGIDGRGGAALDLANPVYLAVADDRVIRRATAAGVPGTSMPAFASAAGGMLTDEQIDAIVKGMRTRWANPSAVAGVSLPPYADPSSGDAARGGAAFATYCAQCHGQRGEGAASRGSIVEGSYLALVSNQGLRTTIIAGRRDLGQPDWRNNVPGHPMTAQEISDVVAWLAARRGVHE
jgi:cytochrome c oxidase cbb3-type subunit III